MRLNRDTGNRSKTPTVGGKTHSYAFFVPSFLKQRMTKNHRKLSDKLSISMLQRLYSSFVHVPQSLDWKPASVGSMVTTAGSSALSLAIMPLKSPVKLLSLS